MNYYSKAFLLIASIAFLLRTTLIAQTFYFANGKITQPMF